MGREQARAFLEDLVRRHGTVGDTQRLLAEHDLEFLRASENLVDVVYRQPRRLPRLTRELAYVAALAAVGAPSDLLRTHMMAAASEGATSGDVLEVLELTVPAAGLPHFTGAVEVWREVFGF